VRMLAQLLAQGFCARCGSRRIGAGRHRQIVGDRIPGPTLRLRCVDVAPTRVGVS
jgi:hypothetical protein